MRKVLVCGGRGYGRSDGELNFLRITLSNLLVEIGRFAVIQGGAIGADAHAAIWADISVLPVVKHPAKWSNGPSAGPIRNSEMLKVWKPELVIAFPGGKGTADMVRKAKAAGVEVREVGSVQGL